MSDEKTDLRKALHKKIRGMQTGRLGDYGTWCKNEKEKDTEEERKELEKEEELKRKKRNKQRKERKKRKKERERMEKEKTKEVESVREMNVCPCRKEEGKVDGWCGVAGPGVPACDH